MKRDQVSASAAVVFRKASKEEFRKYRAEGETVVVRIDPRVKRTLASIGKTIKDETEDFLPRVVAKKL